MVGFSTRRALVPALVVAFGIAVFDLSSNGAGALGTFLAGLVEQGSYRRDISPRVEQARHDALAWDPSGIQSIHLAAGRGRVRSSVTLEPSRDLSVGVEADLRVFADTERHAADYLSELKVTGTRVGGSLLIGLGEARIRPQYISDVEVRWAVRVPDGIPTEVSPGPTDVGATGVRAPLTVRVGTGRVRIRGVAGDVEVFSAGPVDVKDVRGAVKVGGARQAFICDISGDVALDVTGGIGIAERVSGQVRVAARGGSAALREIGGPIVAECRTGDLDVEGLRDTCDVTAEYAAVNVEAECGDIRIRARGGSIRAELGAGNGGYAISAAGRFDDVITDLPVEVSEGQDGTKKATGKVGEGVYLLQIGADNRCVIVLRG
ncbi:MAG: hypothetical protein NUV93_09840 [Firmicutes bacterium]|jgi:hypothetical protein|nr:hypothetical protein [Bacillota bacterium]